MLFLLPNLLDESLDHKLFLPQSVDSAASKLDGLIAESDKAARRFLKRFQTKKILQEMPVKLLNEHTQDSELYELLEPIKKGECWGLISDAGLPCIADPGSKLVRLAHLQHIAVEAFVGPSSLILALMLSGFSGQRFSFHGYLPKEEKERNRQLKLLEEDAKRFGRTHIFIEAPYRSHTLLAELVATLQDDTNLCVAWDLTLPTQGVISQSLREWKKGTLPELQKKPAIFLFAGKNQ